MNAVMAVTLRLPAELGERLFEVVPRGERNAWLVRAVERALGEEPTAVEGSRQAPAGMHVAARPAGTSVATTKQAVAPSSPAPAEQPQGNAQAADGTFSHLAGVPVTRASALVAREFRPYPKGGKR